MFPLRPIGWAVALDELVEPADLWHGMWAASLPALDRLKRRHGGRTVYDSRDVYAHARGLETMAPLGRSLLARLERHWARRVDAVLTVNDAYASILAEQFGVPSPTIVRNTPARYVRPTPTPDRIRDRLGLPASTAIVLYQGGLMTERGIEQGMEAILSVDDAVLVLMGFGSQQDAIVRLARSPRYAERVRVVDPVPPAQLLDWTASADVMLMAIQPTSLNHRYTTPNKLWEAIAAGVPVVASDLPGMASVVRETGCGELVDPTDPAAIARGIRKILDLPPIERARLLERCRAAGARYSWAQEAATLFELYRRLLDGA
jgi:glycogen synthase